MLLFMSLCMTVDEDITHSRGRYSLSARSLLELLSYLKSSYPEDILECTICTEVRFPVYSMSASNQDCP